MTTPDPHQSPGHDLFALSVVDRASALVERERILAERLEPRLRRFVNAAHDLGLSELLTAGFAAVGDDDPDVDEALVRFADLTSRQFDRLVSALEILAEGRQPVIVQVVSEEPLFVSAPVARPMAPDGLHLHVGGSR